MGVIMYEFNDDENKKYSQFANKNQAAIMIPETKACL